MTYGELKAILSEILEKVGPCDDNEPVPSEVIEAILQILTHGWDRDHDQLDPYLCYSYC